MATTADFINITYIIKMGSNTPTTLLSINVIALAVAAGLIRVAAARQALAVHAFLAVFCVARALAGAIVAFLALAWVALALAGAVLAFFAVCRVTGGNPVAVHAIHTVSRGFALAAAYSAAALAVAAFAIAAIVRVPTIGVISMRCVAGIRRAPSRQETDEAE